MSVDEAEKKWQEAKASVDKSKYDTDSAYYAVVTSVFKKMTKVNEEIYLTFEEFINEMFGSSRSEYSANQHLSTTNHTASHVKPLSHTNPYAAVNNKEESRKQEIHGAAATHVRKGDHQAAFSAAYRARAAHQHAIEDRHSSEAAHEIATRKANHAVKTAVAAMKR